MAECCQAVLFHLLLFDLLESHSIPVSQYIALHVHPSISHEGDCGRGSTRREKSALSEEITCLSNTSSNNSDLQSELIHNTIKFLKNVLGVSFLLTDIICCTRAELFNHNHNYLIIAAELAYTHMFKIFG